LKYRSRSEPSLNCGSPTLRFGEVLDFSLSFCLRHPVAWPAAFQITFKNNAECSLVELLRDVFSKNFQSSMPFVWFLMFISFHGMRYHRLYQVSAGMASAVYTQLWRMSTNFTTTSIWIADAHRDDGKRFIVRADEKLTAFVELEAAIRSGEA
jgi:hypothetical protein